MKKLVREVNKYEEAVRSALMWIGWGAVYALVAYLGVDW